MKRTVLLSAVLVLGLVFTSVVAGCSSDSEAAQALQRSLEKTRTLGSRMSMNMTFTTAGETMRMRARATVEAGGRRMRMVSTIGDIEMEQYLDGSTMLMSADSFPAGGGLPAGTRWLKFDLDELLKDSGVDTSMRDLQQMDPTKAAAMLKDADLKDVGSGRVRGVAVDRYRATVQMDDVLRALGGSDAKVPKELEDSTMTMTLSLDDEDLLRAFDMKGDIGPAKTAMDAVITSYSRHIRIRMPSDEGVYDATEALSGLSELSE